jgi:hypothetical protein
MSAAPNPDPVVLHNVLSGELVAWIVKLVLSNGGGRKDILVVLESVTLGICLFMERAGALLMQAGTAARRGAGPHGRQLGLSDRIARAGARQCDRGRHRPGCGVVRLKAAA